MNSIVSVKLTDDGKGYVDEFTKRVSKESVGAA
ncbi:hypothetical protein F442_10865 [Phytophthora nicotianae P10297]|uniref:Uncharacterized protein n=2 Tax=Phytophthora nicotianae TaxID=4792 RepID=W2Z592_PHYNI|nr:hypothetical protein L917_10495 [Phytophthora nicotianae]ETM44206.1 hypothetical protein L914_10538 [Phytophthora nicotianae]ETP42210.1 hypothetical protein F442_10865 [Phytophthora nicotianae P10297]